MEREARLVDLLQPCRYVILNVSLAHFLSLSQAFMENPKRNGMATRIMCRTGTVTTP
jgi:hypothetical protein